MATQGNFDTLFSNIETILNTYSDAQPAAEQFTVYPDFYRPLPTNSDIANVFMYMGELTPTKQGNQAYFEYDQKYELDLIAIGKGTQGASYTRGDKAAGARLRILVQQVLTALFPVDNRELNLTAGLVSSKPLTQITYLPPDMLKSERPIAGARMTLTVGLAWEPTPLVGDTLTAVSVTADIWSALIEP